MEARSHTVELRHLAEELQAIAAAPPEEAMMALGRLVDYTAGEHHVIARLRKARQAAAQSAVARAGSQTKLARALGVSDMLISRVVRGARRHS